jgi:hypothetical protein
MDGLVTAGIFISLVSIIAGVSGLILLTIRDLRRVGLYTLGGAVATFVASIAMVAIGDGPNQEAKELGFADAADRSVAASEGITEGKRWSDLKVTRAVEKAKVERAGIESRDRAQREETARIAAEKAARDEKIAADERAKEQKCREDIQCVGDKKHIEATFACKKFVENLAKNDFQWVDSWSESKFSRFRFKNLKHDTITYVGVT